MPKCKTNALHLPLLLVITGRPGSGKSTLAAAVAQHLGWRAIHRDDFAVAHTTGLIAHQDVNAAFFDAVFTHLATGRCCVIEAAFQHARWVAPLTAATEYAQVALVRCTIDQALALARIEQRMTIDPTRRSLHHDDAYVTQMRQQQTAPMWDSIHMELPTLNVDATVPVVANVSAIQTFVASLSNKDIKK